MASGTFEIEGNLGKDAVESEKADLTTISVAVSEKWESNGEKQERTTWYNVQAWGKMAASAARLKKGMSVRVKGRMYHDTWQSNGEKRSGMVFNASSIRVNDWSIFNAEQDDAE